MVSNKKITTKASSPLATTDRMASFEHLDADDFSVPALHLHQGTGTERMKYGDEHAAGAWVHTLSGKDVAGETFAYVLCTHEDMAWWKMDSTAGDGIHSRYPKGTMVPVELRANPDISVVPTLNLYVLLAGDNVPSVIRCKSTALPSVKAVNSLERGRAAAGDAVGLYVLGSDDRSSDQYQWKVPRFTPAADADEATMAKVALFRDMLLTTAVRVTDGDDSAVHVPPGQSQAKAVKTLHPDVDESSIPF